MKNCKNMSNKPLSSLLRITDNKFIETMIMIRYWGHKFIIPNKLLNIN